MLLLVNLLTKLLLKTALLELKRKGIQGEPDLAGSHGPQGEIGPQGPQGEKGDKGDTGPAGQQKKSSTADIYSTEETRIGRWIDGKPTYKRVFSGNMASDTTIFSHLRTVLNYDTIVKITASLGFSSLYALFYFYNYELFREYFYL